MNQTFMTLCSSRYFLWIYNLPYLRFSRAHPLRSKVLLSGASIYLAEDRENIPSMPHSLWLALVTMTTVGYGDYYPKTSQGRIWSTCQGLQIGATSHIFHRGAISVKLWNDFQLFLLQKPGTVFKKTHQRNHDTKELLKQSFWREMKPNRFSLEAFPQ